MGINVVTCSASSIVGVNNFGDELLTKIYHAWVIEADPSVTVSHLAVDSHGILTRESRKQIEGASYLIFTGGGYFADGDFTFHHTIRRHLRALRNRRVYWTVFKLSRKLDLTCAVVGLEVGPLANPLYRRAVRNVLLSGRKVVVRNEESRVYARNLCGDALDVSVHLDAALAAASDFAAGEGVLARNPEDFNIGIHVHSVEGEITQADCMALIAQVVSHLPSGRQARLYYFHDQRKNGRHPSRSVRAERHVISAYPGTTPISYRSPEVTTRAVDAMDLLITSKLHLGIVARSLGVPVIALGGHPKIRRFYKSIGEEEVCGRSRDFISNGLPTQVTSCIGGDQARVAVSATYRESALSNRAAVRQLLKSMA